MTALRNGPIIVIKDTKGEKRVMNRRYRKTVIAGNWKMNMTATETKKFAEDLKKIADRVFGPERVTCIPELPDGSPPVQRIRQTVPSGGPRPPL